LLLYYITDRTHFPGTESQRRESLLKKVSEAAKAGVDYIQLREKDLPARELESLAQQSAQIINSRSHTRLLINSRTDIALAIGAHGVHLTANDISPVDVRKIWREAHGFQQPIVAISCHTEAEVIAAQSASADFVVFGPVFEKLGSKQTAAGLGQLQKVCQHRVPVLALGGVTIENAHLCLQAGASGVAGIRLFQENDLAESVVKLRA
jgi:thiamine-phosphate pyrophosphorylase